uniref:AlNc14C378G11198 protein n=1 Tax=Albugo laibachii Nc14 TaxID=890382 RepID=F0WYD8_9STRA|nr:AlNc14C378G11198 [Albugo laibachii Nc14]|eukprot:CCA26491.1 AlNc14C378G11198 [Albugo laibachii Nc14]
MDTNVLIPIQFHSLVFSAYAFIEMNCHMLERQTLTILSNYRYSMEYTFKALEMLLQVRGIDAGFIKTWKEYSASGSSAFHASEKKVRFIHYHVAFLNQVIDGDPTKLSDNCQNHLRHATTILSIVSKALKKFHTFFYHTKLDSLEGKTRSKWNPVNWFRKDKHRPKVGHRVDKEEYESEFESEGEDEDEDEDRQHLRHALLVNDVLNYEEDYPHYVVDHYHHY